MKKKLFWILGIYILVSVFLIGFSPKEISWRDYFTSKSKQPYGLFIFKDLVDNIFDDVETKEAALYRLADNPTKGENYIFISDKIQFSEDERNSLLTWVSQGNNAFISSKYFSQDLLDTLKVRDNYIYTGYQSLGEGSVRVRSVQSEEVYTFEKQYDIQAFRNLYDSLKVINSLAVNMAGAMDARFQPITVQVSFGEGSFYLCSLPYA
jgi:hypothetical protein